MTTEEYNARVEAMVAREAKHRLRMSTWKACLPCFVAMVATYALGLITMYLILR